MKRNPNFEAVSERYLFLEVKERVLEFLKKKPEAKLISLSIGDTTEPLAPSVSKAISQMGHDLGSLEGYKGYGPEQGISELREAVSKKLYNGKIKSDDVFISDGAKCDIGRLQILFGQSVKVAIPEPAYPAYLDTALISRGAGVILLPCRQDNDFIPDLSQAEDADIIYICSPNNPTGTTLSYEVLKKMVSFAKERKKIILFDAAYAMYVQDSNTPSSIYDIEGAEDVAIEIGSFSKMAGFSGVRLGWSVVPESLKYDNGKSIKSDWLRVLTTFYNGASILAQKGGLSALSDQGMLETKKQVMHYLENARLLREALQELNINYWGGVDSPYIWAQFPNMTSWQAFQMFLEAEIVTTPGIGFGPTGDGFLRISSFGRRETIDEAVRRVSKTVANHINF